MAEKPATDKPTKTGASTGAESPTTARELDFDDDNDAPAPATTENVASPPPSKSPKPGVRFQEESTEIPPPKPPRPMSPQQQAENQLVEAFPSIDKKVITAVVRASRGNVDVAFEALLGMSDPDYKPEEAPPPRPPRPTQQSQEPKSDWQIAQELQARLDAEERAQYGSRSRGQPQQRGPRPNEYDDDRDHSFFDDDLPVIKKNIEQGFRETQTKVNKFLGDMWKKFDGEGEEERFDKYGNPIAPSSSQQRQDFGPSQSDQIYGIRKSAEARRSADHNRYDTDNRVLGDDFEALELRDDEAPAQQRSHRPSANPDLFKPTPVSPPQSGPVDEVDALYRNPSPNNNSSNNNGKSGGKKWQPLTSIAPHPETDDHDPFSLGDSDEEDAKTKDIRAEDSERLKKQASNKESTSGPELKEATRSGSIDATAEALLKDTK